MIRVMMTFITRGGQGREDTSKDRKATRSEGRLPELFLRHHLPFGNELLLLLCILLHDRELLPQECPAWSLEDANGGTEMGAISRAYLKVRQERMTRRTLLPVARTIRSRRHAFWLSSSWPPAISTLCPRCGQTFVQIILPSFLHSCRPFFPFRGAR